MYVDLSCTQPAKSAWVILFGAFKSGELGSVKVTGAFSSVTRAAGCRRVIGYGMMPGLCISHRPYCRTIRPPVRRQDNKYSLFAINNYLSCSATGRTYDV